MGYAQSVASANPASFTLDSKVLNEKCKVFVYLPEPYEAGTEAYPVVYVLDGEYYSSFTADAATLLRPKSVGSELYCHWHYDQQPTARFFSTAG